MSQSTSWWSLLFAVISMTAVVDYSAHASTMITFEDTNTANEQPLYGGYAGLSWQNVQTMNTDWWAQTNNPINGYVHGAISPPTVAWVPTDGLSDRASATISSSTPFGFISAALTSAWNDNLQLQVYGYLGGQLVGSQTVTLNPSSPTIATFNFLSVDKVELVASGGTRDPAFAYPPGISGPPSPIFVMDNITVDEPGVGSPGPVTTAPEPSTFVIGFLLTAANGMRRRLAGNVRINAEALSN